jgi:hypothetical protein
MSTAARHLAALVARRLGLLRCAHTLQPSHKALVRRTGLNCGVFRVLTTLFASFFRGLCGAGQSAYIRAVLAHHQSGCKTRRDYNFEKHLLHNGTTLLLNMKYDL